MPSRSQLLLGLVYTLCWVSSALLISITPPNQTPDFVSPINIFHIEANFCSAPPRLSDAQIAKVVKADPFDACQPLTNTAEVNGSIVLVTRGNQNCLFYTKVANVQAAGGIAEILVDSTDKTAPIRQAAASNTLAVFAKMSCLGIRLVDAQVIFDAMNSGQTVWGKLYQEPLDETQSAAFQSFLNQTSPSQWNQSLDICTTTLPSIPSRGGAGFLCDERGFITWVVVDWPMGGPIPAVVGNFTGMIYFSLQDDETLDGAMPDELCKWKNLTVLIISGTGLTSFSQVAFSNWPELREFNLESNRIQQQAPFPGPKLQVLDMSNNEAEGALPENYFASGALKRLDLSQNCFTGTVPDFSNSPIDSINLDGNSFVALAPLNRASSLTTFSISNNALFSIPSAYFTRMPNLTNLAISGNRLAGDIPRLPPSLVSFIAGKNSWSTTTSLSATSVPLLQVLDLSSCQLRGITFLDLVTSLPSPLLKLDLSDNFLDGHFLLQRLPLLSYLDASHNLISGPIDPTDFQKVSGYYCDLSFNNLSGIIPDELGSIQFTRLAFLGNPDMMRGKSTPIPSWASYTFNRTVILDVQGLECPVYYFTLSPIGEVLLDPSYHGYSLCRCLPNYYYHNSSRSLCVPCLEHARCPGKGDPEHYDKNLNIIANPGYYPTPDTENPVLMVPCQFQSLLPGSSGNPCNPENVTADNSFACLTGYTGYLCSNCVEGYFPKQGFCADCSGRLKILNYIVGALTIVGVLFYFVFWRTGVTIDGYENQGGLTDRIGNALSMVLPMVVDFYQTSVLVLTRINRAILIITLDGVIRTSTVNPTFGLGLECDLPGLRYYPRRALLTLLFPICFLSFVCLLFLVKRLWQYRQERRRAKREGTEPLNFDEAASLSHQQRSSNTQLLVYCVSNLCYLMYLPLSEFAISLFRCSYDPVSGYYYLQDQPSVGCAEVGLGVKVFFLVLYPVGFGLSFLFLAVYLSILSFKNPEALKQNHLVQNFGFFYLDYKENCVYASLFFVARQAILSLVVGYASASEDSYSVYIFLVLGVDLVFVLWRQPYALKTFNKLRAASILVIIFVFYNAIAYSSSQFLQNTDAPVVNHLILNGLMIYFFLVSTNKAMKESEEERERHEQDDAKRRTGSGEGTEPPQENDLGKVN